MLRGHDTAPTPPHAAGFHLPRSEIPSDYLFLGTRSVNMLSVVLKKSIYVLKINICRGRSRFVRSLAHLLSFSLFLSFRTSFSVSPLLDSAEIIDRVHYARAVHRYLHIPPALRRARCLISSSCPRILNASSLRVILFTRIPTLAHKRAMEEV